MTDAKTVKLAHLMGPTDTPLVNKTIGQAVNDAAVQFGDQDAIVSVHQDIRLSFRELATKTDQLACGFLALGLAPGDRVGIWAPNCVEWAAVQYATAKAGLILVNINPAYRTSELEYAINKVGCKALLTATRFKTSDYIAMLCELAPELPKAEPGKLKSEKLPSLSSIITIGDDTHRGCYRYDDVAMMGGADETAKLNAITAEIKPEDPINIQFTSGTTGSPKGATLSHHNILNNALFTGERMRLTERDRMCVPVPLYHCFGMVIGNLTNLLRGTATIYPSEAFDAHATLTAVERERCTGLHGVPTMFVGVLEALDRGDYDVSTLRTGVMAGAPCPVAVMHRVVSDMNMVDITIGYGMTETSPLSWQTGPDDPLERRVSTVGTVHPHAEVMVADEQGNPLPCGTQGEFRTRGYCVMIGYWNDPERTAEAITEDGWMCTGDLGVIDEAGYGNITGRVKDMVIRGGENLFPREIEEALFTHPAVQDVQVFGVPDDKYGEELCAWIILKPGQHTTEAEIKAYFKGKIAHFKIPRYVRFADSFPMTVTGKARKVEMRRLMSEALDLEQQKTA